ncbi:hypothetical protein ID866_11136 [Astraeus odoratus]|nr:hypothetical protein ID866_11136 [Astraeus odoratus]
MAGDQCTSGDLLFWRFVQAFGCSGAMPIGAAVIGDIYALEERGTAMGSFFGASLFGLAVAPLTGGTAAQYWSWRGFQIALGTWGFVQMAVMYLYLPETAHPNTRGIDKSGAVTQSNCYDDDGGKRIRDQYRLCADDPAGLHDLGAHIAGRLSDVIVKKYKRERNGIWYPEDRLRMTSIGALYLTPLSVSVAGLTMTYIGGRLGLTICLLCLFTNGVGVNMVLTPMGSYVVDLMGPRSAEVMAAGGALRSFLLAPLSALIIPSINLTGIAVTNGIAAVLALIGYLLIWATIRHGDQLRTYLDIGYTTASN